MNEEYFFNLYFFIFKIRFKKTPVNHLYKGMFFTKFKIVYKKLVNPTLLKKTLLVNLTLLK